MNTTASTDPPPNQGNNSPRAMAFANHLVWRVSVTLLCGMGVLLLLFWNRSVSLAVIGGTAALWFLFTGFVHYFFRDPAPDVPQAPNLLVSPAHGLVDVVDETSDLEFMGGPCQRISIFLSVFDVHVQYAPAAGKVVWSRHQPGRFLSAVGTDSANHNENQIIGLQLSEAPDERVAVKQIAGFIARRIRTWVMEGEAVSRGGRLGLIQFGSRCELYLPLSAQLMVQPGDRVVGGETVVATRPLASAEGKTSSGIEIVSQL
jgi:phosphatidylserine decarboxylase